MWVEILSHSANDWSHQRVLNSTNDRFCWMALGSMRDLSPLGWGYENNWTETTKSTQPCMHVINKQKCNHLLVHKQCNHTKPHRCIHELNTNEHAHTHQRTRRHAQACEPHIVVRIDTSTTQQWSKQLLLLGILIAPGKRCWHYISCVGRAGVSVCRVHGGRGVHYCIQLLDSCMFCNRRNYVW